MTENSKRTAKTQIAPEQVARLVRLLNLLPYFLGRKNWSLVAAARELGVSVAQLQKDLDLLFLCGKPGKMPDDLVELEQSLDAVSITNAQGLDQPLRLTPIEAAVLLLALEALAHADGLVAAAAIESAAQKIRSLLKITPAGQVERTATPGEAQTLAAIRTCFEHSYQLRFTYASATGLSQRQVAPNTVFTHAGAQFLVAWDVARQAHRRFALSKMSQVEVIPEVAHAHDYQLHFDPADPFGFSGEDAPLAHLRIAPSAQWVLEYFPLQEVTTAADGWKEGVTPVVNEQTFIQFVCRLGGEIVVTAPKHLMNSLKNFAQHTLAVYDQQQTD